MRSLAPPSNLMVRQAHHEAFQFEAGRQPQESRLAKNPDNNVTPAGSLRRHISPVTTTPDRRRTMTTATKHKTATRDEWLKARLALLKDEKALTHKSDELAERRQDLPWVAIDKAY